MSITSILKGQADESRGETPPRRRVSFANPGDLATLFITNEMEDGESDEEEVQETPVDYGYGKLPIPCGLGGGGTPNYGDYFDSQDSINSYTLRKAHVTIPPKNNDNASTTLSYTDDYDADMDDPLSSGDFSILTSSDESSNDDDNDATRPCVVTMKREKSSEILDETEDDTCSFSLDDYHPPRQEILPKIIAHQGKKSNKEEKKKKVTKQKQREEDPTPEKKLTGLEEKKRARAERLVKAKARILKEQQEQQEILLNEASGSLSDNDRLQKAYTWYNRCGRPTKTQFRKKIKKMTKVDGYCELSLEDIDILPWTQNESHVHLESFSAILRS